MAAADKGYYVLVLIAVLNSIISLYYYLLVVKAMFLEKGEEPISFFRSDRAMRASLVICVLGILVVGFISGIFEHIRALSLQLY